MNPDPATDVIAFLTKPAWYTAVFWLLLIASAAIAAYAAARIPEQRTGRHFARWVFRLVIGAMWWQQTLWKLPPYYTDQPDAPFGTTGLAAWMKISGRARVDPFAGGLCQSRRSAEFLLVPPIVYLAELLTALSLMLGAFVGLFGMIGALQIINLWLGLYSAPNEWPWTYFFLIVLQLIFAFDHYGRSLGIDALLAKGPGRGRLLGWVLLKPVLRYRFPDHPAAMSLAAEARRAPPKSLKRMADRSSIGQHQLKGTVATRRIPGSYRGYNTPASRQVE